MKDKTLYLTRSALIAALYVALTCISNALGLASGAIQVRISEALCVLPALMPSAVSGVTVGCLIFNVIFSGNPLDMIFGTLATLIGALGALLFKKRPYLASIPTIISNAVIIPFVIALGTSDGQLVSVPFYMLTVGLGELISCGILGAILIGAMKKVKLHK